MKHPANHIFEHTPDSLAAWCESVGMPRFRAKQILEWVYQKGIADPALMTSLSKRDRDLLAAEMTFLSGTIVRRQSATDGVEKLLIEWTEEGTEAPRHEGTPGVALPVVGSATGDTSRQTECVMIPSEDRRTACISSQVGCPVGCRFCASGLGGLEGNLSAGRIVEQVWRLGDAIRESAGAEGEAAGPLAVRGSKSRITNVVFMGMGEPLANFAAVTSAIRTICALWGLGISARKVTISTVGLPQAIERLADQFELPVTLALSLHAPNDDVRRQLIPWAEYTTIKDLLAACQKWFAKTGREITLEYTLLRGVNDRPEHAAELAQVAKTLRANINLIRYNEVEGLPFKRPRTEDVREFQELLRARGINSHIRASRGRDIAAACGQLRHEARSRSGA
ncbi:MAG: 23S rRNA (adenine(2503)-C(2))-methyltransferase RlmN [Phycisphaerales bacterium]|nr:23S rRNA (adenine(2503)-C(2))-methyltransferase RlmN [Phycisphaerales bacterium]